MLDFLLVIDKIIIYDIMKTRAPLAKGNYDMNAPIITVEFYLRRRANAASSAEGDQLAEIEMTGGEVFTRTKGRHGESVIVRYAA